MQKTWKFQIITFGCKVNQYESQAIREAWLRAGAEESPDVEQAAIIVLNSCAITAKGERDARQMLSRLRRRAPQAKLILTGCAARLLAQNTLFPASFDLLLSHAEKPLLLEPERLLQRLGRELEQSPQPIPLPAPSSYPPFQISRYQRARPVLKVQDGCTHRCTYCIVPTLRQHATSRSPAEIVEEARRLLSQGYAELIISGINLKQYGKNEPEFGNFWDLLKRLDDELADEYADRARLRISSVEPSQLNAHGLETLKNCRMLCPQLHISLQHASQRILRRMGRGHYQAKDLADAVQCLQSFWPKFGLGCDLICGFPGEEEEDHAELLSFCQSLPFTYAHVFPYSPRPGTAAAAFPGHVDEKIQARRALALRKLFQTKNRDFREMLLKEKTLLTIVLEGKHGQREKGVCQYYIPCYLQSTAGESDPLPRGLLTVRAIGLTSKGLTVGLCHNQEP
ncbi:MAG: MiaB/RimO family radical SAM methylthiotransferase [Desulfovibrio sp.]|nr:MiaB/RimO family radical SAM methylthiotransferase [Desulfovibrio sp.]